MAGFSPRGTLRALHRAALAGADPGAAVARALGSREVRRALSGASRVGLFAAGKAAAGMARAALERVATREILVVLPKGHPAAGLPAGRVAFGAHPEPDAASVRAAKRALAFFRGFGPEDVVLCLVSGGASSILALPRAGVTLAAKRRAVRALARAGAPIEELNRLRASLSAVKAGRLGRATRARLVTLVLSDVPGDRAALVGSGPTVRGRRGDRVRIVGTNASGLDAAAREARRRGIAVFRDARRLAGPADAAGRRLARRARGLPEGSVLLAGGETTVALGRSRGRGGRTLELALAAALALDGDPSVRLLAAGSDGRDGSSGAAGAFADGSTAARARRRGVDPAAALARHDSRAVFAPLRDLLLTGPTGGNVGDWVFLLRPGRSGRPGGRRPRPI